jgi:hypothetical protein
MTAQQQIADAAIFEPPQIAEQILQLMDRSDANEMPADVPDFGEFITDPRRADDVNAALAYLEAMALMTQAEIARQQARHRAIEETTYQLSRAVLTAMEQADTTTIHGLHCTLRRRLNPPAVRIEDETLIPETFKRALPPVVQPPPVPDKTAIKKAIEADIYVPGAILTRGSRLERK